VGVSASRMIKGATTSDETKAGFVDIAVDFFGGEGVLVKLFYAGDLEGGCFAIFSGNLYFIARLQLGQSPKY